MILETKRLILRKPKKSDWKEIVEGVGNLEVARMISQIPHPYTKKDAEFFIKKCIKEWHKKSYEFLIELKSENKVIGVMAIHPIDKFSGTAQTGSWINKKY